MKQKARMFVLALCASLCAGSSAMWRDTTKAAPPDTAPLSLQSPAPADTLLGKPEALAPVDTIVAVRRRKAVVTVEYGDWYSRRLTMHRWASYTTLPLFAGNYVTGQQLLANGSQAPAWAIRAHGPLASSVTTLFGVNTLTGVWNLWEGRADPSGRGWRVMHAVLMLGADAGFATAGLLSKQAERSDERRRLHRTVALTSIGAALASYVMMLPPLRRD